MYGVHDSWQSQTKKYGERNKLYIEKLSYDVLTINHINGMYWQKGTA